MRYPSEEKLEIIRLVEQSHLSAKQTLDKLGIPRSTFYRWYDLYQTGGVDALEDRSGSVFLNSFDLVYKCVLTLIKLPPGLVPAD